MLFQNDHINTLDTDSEFRLAIMAGVAQDEVRKLSERIRFGFCQSIKNGRVLGNDKLYGYDKKETETVDRNLDVDEIRRTLETELDFSEGVNSALVSTILEKVVVKKGSTRKEIYLNIYLKPGQQYECVYVSPKTSASIIR